MAGLVDLNARGRFRVTGADRVRFLHSMLTNDIEHLSPGQGCRAALLTTKGKLLGELVVYCEAESLWLETDGATRAKMGGTLLKHIIMDDVEINDITEQSVEIGVYGADAAEVLADVVGVPAAKLAALPPYHHIEMKVAAAPELGMPGFHLFGQVDLPGDKWDEAEVEVRRIEAGRARYGVDMDEDRLLLEAGLDDAVNLTKGCYLGQEVIARATSRGHINKKLVGLFLDGERAAERGAKLATAQKPDAGVVTSSVFSPRLGRAIALGYLHRSVWEPGTPVRVVEASGERGAVVAALPFSSG